MHKLLSGRLEKKASWFKAKDDIFTYRHRFDDKHSNIDLKLFGSYIILPSTHSAEQSPIEVPFK